VRSLSLNFHHIYYGVGEVFDKTNVCLRCKDADLVYIYVYILVVAFQVITQIPTVVGHLVEVNVARPKRGRRMEAVIHFLLRITTSVFYG
jgi:hypothetical protein